MTGRQRLARVLLWIAVRRWPAARRDELAREWSAELHAILADGNRWEALRFAASLAVSRPARLSTFDMTAVTNRRVFFTTLTLFAAPLLAMVVAGVALIAFMLPVLPFFDWLVGPAQDTHSYAVRRTTFAAISLSIGQLLQIAAVIWAGRWAGRRSALVRPTALAVGVAAGSACGLVPIAGIRLFGIHLSVSAGNYWALVTGTVVWAVVVAAVLWRVAELVGAGRRRSGWLVGATGGLFAMVSSLVHAYAQDYSQQLLFTSAFALAYVIGAMGRPEPVTAPSGPRPETPPPARSASA